jgi:hypothetical protein
LEENFEQMALARLAKTPAWHCGTNSEEGVTYEITSHLS